MKRAKATHRNNPSRTQLKRIYARLNRTRNVVACYLGFKYSKGRRRRTVAIVCLVSEKKGARTLTARDRIPKTISWRGVGGKRYEIPTDVVRIRAPGELCAATSGPGDGCVILEPGSVGFAMNHPTMGNVVTTAGHCALRTNEPAGNYDFSISPRPAQIRNISPPGVHAARALAASCTMVFDYALVRPDDAAGCTNFHRSGIRVTQPPRQDPSLGVSVTLLTSTGPSKVATLIGVHGQAPLGKAGRMVDVILTTPVLRGGDSGGLLTLTASREALGQAVGFIRVDANRIISVFMPVASVLKREGGMFL